MAGFAELSRSRRVDGMSGSVSGIPPSEVAAWMDLHAIAVEKRARFVDGVGAMDVVYLRFVEKKREAGADGDGRRAAV